MFLAELLFENPGVTPANLINFFFYSVVLRASRIILMHYSDTRTHHHNINPSFTTKSNPVADALRTKKTKCTEAGTNAGSLQMMDSKRATLTIWLLCPNLID